MKVSDHFEDNVAEFQELLEVAEACAYTDEDTEFVDRMSRRFEDYEADAYLSHEELSRLRKIAEFDEE